jgi:UDP-N-acetylmuramate dehydrogenase
MWDKTSMHNKLSKLMDSTRLLLNEPMKNHTSFRIGGPVDLLVIPENLEELKDVLKVCSEDGIRPEIIGNGSNLLVLDGGIRGMVVKISNNFNSIQVDEEYIYAHAGCLLSTIAKKAMDNSLTGIEFAGGIPGTLGGAVFMNAGAYGGEMADVVYMVDCLDYDGNTLKLTNSDMKFGYRYSLIQDGDLIITSVCLKLKKGDFDEIKHRMDELAMKRKEKQPLFLPSAGSTFKRPDGFFAGKLIEDAGMKGYRVGNAQVSEIHAGFIVNMGNSTAKDVLALIKKVQEAVKSKFDVQLVPEIKIIGEPLD